MAADLVGDAFLSAPIRTMIDTLTSTDVLNYFNHKKLNLSLLMQLQTTLLALAPVLDDAEKKQIYNLDVKKWLDELKDAIYDAEDFLNQISYDSLRCKVTNQVRNFLSSLFNTNGDINSQIKKLCERLQLFAQQIETLDLQMMWGTGALQQYEQLERKEAMHLHFRMSMVSLA
ncbi:hypothetical protein P8452_65624 [Trifolium repens]|nr:hypothetical protein P8452_65624 [Trifolium repens]